MAETAGDPFEALGDPNRREILRLLGAGDLAVGEIADGDADQPACGLAAPAAAQGRRPRGRAGRGHPPDLPAAGRGPGGGAGLPPGRVGRGSRPVPAGRREHDPTSQRRRGDDRAAAAVVRRRLLGRARVHGLDGAHRHLVAARPHGHRRPDRSCSRPASGAASSSAPRTARSTTGARSRSGSRRDARVPLAPRARDPDDATEVEIRFLPTDGDATRVEIEHRGWERSAGPPRPWRDRNRSAGAACSRTTSRHEERQTLTARDQGRSVGAHHAPGQLGVHDVPRRAATRPRSSARSGRRR